MSVLSARDLAIAPPGVVDPVVRGASLEVARGEWVAFSGPNGCGKSTLALGLAGLWPLRAGSIRIEGERLAPGESAARRKVAVLLQDPSAQLLQPTVAEELTFTARNLDQPTAQIEARVARWVAALGLAPLLQQDPQTLSAGFQQRVLIAAAMVSAPRLLIADEPAVHLDPPSRARVLELLQEEVAEGLAIVWITQDPDELSAAGRRVVLTGPEEPTADLVAPMVAVPEGRERARIRVAAWEGEQGPRVEGDTPIEIVLGSAGVVALLGRNGSGKSVLLASLAGVLRLPQVEIRWSEPQEVRPILTTQHPELQLFEEIVRDEIAYAAVSRGMDRLEVLARAERWLCGLGFDGPQMLARRVWDLSGGEKRLISVISALLAPASVVALDEPTAGLDLAHRLGLAALISTLSQSVPVVVATQDHRWVERLGARSIWVGR